MKLSLPIKIMICVFGCMSLGFLSGFAAGSAITDWYTNLNKPFFQPPPWIFGPAWTILYILIGIAIALIWHKEKSINQSKAIQVFISQFILNLIWSPVFFAFKQPAMALGIIIILWILIVLTMKAFKKLDNRAMWLLVPYLCWVTFATILNASIVYLN